MPISPDLGQYIQQRKLLQQSEHNSPMLAKLPRLHCTDDETLEKLHGTQWHEIDTMLQQTGLEPSERKLIHEVLKDVGEIKLQTGIIHRVRVGEIRSLSNEELILLGCPHECSPRILRALFGGTEDMVAEGKPAAAPAAL